MGGGGNWEFQVSSTHRQTDNQYLVSVGQVYQNNRSTSYVKDGILYIKPGLTADFFGMNGDAEVRSAVLWMGVGGGGGGGGDGDVVVVVE